MIDNTRDFRFLDVTRFGCAAALFFKIMRGILFVTICKEEDVTQRTLSSSDGS